jgi:hypothetical protein
LIPGVFVEWLRWGLDLDDQQVEAVWCVDQDVCSRSPSTAAANVRNSSAKPNLEGVLDENVGWADCVAVEPLCNDFRPDIIFGYESGHLIRIRTLVVKKSEAGLA